MENKFINNGISGKLKYYEETLDYQEYFLIKDNIIYKIIIVKNDNCITIISRNYKSLLTLNKLSSITKMKFNNIDSAYKYIINLFEDNKAIIKNIIKKSYINLILNLDNKTEIEITLVYDGQHKNILIDKINYLSAELKFLNERNKILSDEIEKLKKINSKDNPKDLKICLDIAPDSYASTTIDNSFTVFKSINDILYLIYVNENKSIISYDLNKQKKISEIKNVFKTNITNFKHFLDEKKKRDLIMTMSLEGNNIKVFNVNNWECICQLNDVNSSGWLESSCFLNNNEDNYIVTSNYNNLYNPEAIKVFDFKGNKIKEIKNSNYSISNIESYNDKKLSEIYIITGNKGYVNSYNYDKNELYHKYYDNSEKIHFNAIIKEDLDKVKLIESCYDGIVRIWNFHTGLLLNKYKLDEGIRTICLWDDNYLFIGSINKNIKLVNLTNGLIVKSLISHKKEITSIKKIKISKYGECLISQGWKNDGLKIWININYIYDT